MVEVAGAHQQVTVATSTRDEASGSSNALQQELQEALHLLFTRRRRFVKLFEDLILMADLFGASYCRLLHLVAQGPYVVQRCSFTSILQVLLCLIEQPQCCSEVAFLPSYPGHLLAGCADPIE